MPVKQVDNYLIDRRLGRGACGELWLGRDAHSSKVVLMRVFRRSAILEVHRLRHELQILRSTSRILDLKKTSSRFYLVLEATAQNSRFFGSLGAAAVARDLDPIPEADIELESSPQQRQHENGATNFLQEELACSIQDFLSRRSLACSMRMPMPKAKDPSWNFGGPGTLLRTAVYALRAAGCGASSSILAGRIVAAEAADRQTYRPALPQSADGDCSRGPLAAFCIGQLQSSHLFRLRTAQLFPRILYLM